MASKRTSAKPRVFLMVLPLQFFRQLAAVAYVYYENGATTALEGMEGSKRAGAIPQSRGPGA
jgi:hypothetical protein